jgi:FkbM family methyltransferase
VLVLLVLAVMAIAALVHPAFRTHAFFAFKHTWDRHWPLSFGESVPWRLAKTMDRIGMVPIRREVEPQISLLLDPADLVGRAILDKGTWETETWGVIDRRLPAGGTFIDVGAHIGYYSLKAAKKVGPDGRVLAIEPNPHTAAELRENIRHSGAHQVEVEEVACSSAEGTLELFSASRANTGRASLARQNATVGSSAPVKFQVRARPLDDVVRERKLMRVDVIKADVEGAEHVVLLGSQETLRRFRPVLMLEFVDRQLRAMNSSAEQLTAFLTNLGYQPAAKANVGVSGANVEWVPVSNTPKLMCLER